MMKKNKWVCDDCGSDWVVYMTDAEFDPNDDDKFIQQNGYWDSMDWCHECENECTIIDEREYVSKDDDDEE